MPQFRKKPVVVEAIRIRDILNGLSVSWAGLPGWVRDALKKPSNVHGSVEIRMPSDYGRSAEVFIRTPEGVMRANADAMLIKGVQGELYACRADIFAETYDEVAPEPEPSTPVISLAQARADRDHDNSALTVADNLEATLMAVKEGRMAAGQSIILLLDRESDEAAYNIIIRTSKLRRSESLALLHASAALLANRLIGAQ